MILENDPFGKSEKVPPLNPLHRRTPKYVIWQIFWNFQVKTLMISKPNDNISSDCNCVTFSRLKRLNGFTAKVNILGLIGLNIISPKKFREIESHYHTECYVLPLFSRKNSIKLTFY